MKKFKNYKKILSIVLIALLALLLIMPVFQFAPARAASKSQINNSISNLKTTLADIKSHQKELNESVASIREDQRTTIERIAQLSSEILLLTDELDTVYKLIDEYELLIEEKYSEITELEGKQEAQKNRLAGILKMSYEYGSDNYLEILFGSKDFGDFLSRLDYLSYFLGSSQSIIDELDATYAKILETTQIYEDSLKSLDEYRASSEELHSSLEAKKAEEEEALSRLNEDEAKELAELEKYNNDRKETEREIANLSAELKRIEDAERRAREEAERKKQEQNKKNNNTTSKATTTSTYSGTFGWPLNGYSAPSSAYISSGYGYRTNPITKRSEFHNGIDLPAPSGTPIYAPADGVVSSSGVKGGYGNCVVISHGGGVVTLYGHASTLHCKAGQSVKKGDLIARVGTTGQSTGNHLHFTIYEGGATVNPMSYYK